MSMMRMLLNSPWRWMKMAAGGTGALLRIVSPPVPSSTQSGFDHPSLTFFVLQVVIVGLAMGLFGYDNAFASPLVSLPLFVERYQGPGFQGALVFSVRPSRSKTGNGNLMLTGGI